jgi:hypothetical protein
MSSSDEAKSADQNLAGRQGGQGHKEEYVDPDLEWLRDPANLPTHEQFLKWERMGWESWRRKAEAEGRMRAVLELVGGQLGRRLDDLRWHAGMLLQCGWSRLRGR